MKPILSASLFATCVLMVCAGCSTISSRIESYPQAFAQATPQQQELMRSGRVDVGFTKEMVIIALGKPEDVVQRRDVRNGETERWMYFRYADSASFNASRECTTWPDHFMRSSHPRSIDDPILFHMSPRQHSPRMASSNRTSSWIIQFKSGVVESVQLRAR